MPYTTNTPGKTGRHGTPGPLGKLKGGFKRENTVKPEGIKGPKPKPAKKAK